MRHEHGGNIYSNKCDIDFSANINPIGMGIEIKEAFFNSFDMSACYPDPECRELKKLVSEKENVSAENIICSNGAAELIFAVCFAMKPRKALIAAPCFAEYEQALSSVGCETEKYILDEKNGFAFDNGFISAIRNGIDIVFFTNPNNPTGNICDSGYVESIAAKCADCGATAVFDECFIDFVENGEKFTAKKYLNYGNMIILKAFTKFYAMPG